MKSFFVKKYFLNMLWACLLIGLGACGSPHHDKASSDGNAGAGNAPVNKRLSELLTKPEEIIFDHVKEFVLNPSCVECHSSSGDKRAGVDLSSFEAISGVSARKVFVAFDPLASSMYETLLVTNGSRQMPPKKRGQLSEDQKNLVFQWIKNGAKTEVAQVVERPKSLSEELQPFFDDPKIIDFPIVKKYVFDTSCTLCHAYNGAKADDDAILYGQNMSEFKDYFGNSGIVKNILEDKIISDGDGGKKKLKGSRIYKSIAINQSMPPAENGYQPMDSLRVKLLRLWILNCAIEDYSLITEDTLLDKAKSGGKVRDCVEPEEPS